MQKLKRFIKGSFIAVMLSMVLSLGLGFAYAQEPADAPAQSQTFEEALEGQEPVPPQSGKNTEDIVEGVATLATKVHRLFSPMINYFAFQIGNFLGNDYIFQGAMGQMLHRIWVTTRNLVNIAFVFLLLWMAIKEIFFVGIETDLKKRLLIFTLLLISVNFSWLATKVVLDAASVVTHVIFAIPSGISGSANATGIASAIDVPQCITNNADEQPVQGACIPSAIFTPQDAGTSKVLYFQESECDKVKAAYSGSADSAYNENGTISADASETNQKLQRRVSICMENMNFFKYDQNTAVIYLTYGMARIQNLVNANASTDAIQLSVGVLLSLIMQAAYAMALVALFVVLIVRMLMLWIFVGFSPFMVLVIWFKGGEDAGSEFKFGFKEFINWAFVPAKIGAVFAISFIMISAGQALGGGTVDTVSSSGLTFKIFEGQSLFMGAGSLQTFLWLLMSIVVLWMGTFSAFKDMGIIGGFSSYITERTRSVARYAAKAPLVAPIIPLGSGQNTSLLGVANQFDFTDKIRELESKALQRPTEAIKLSNNAKNLRATDIRPILDHPQNEAHMNRLADRLGYRNAANLTKNFSQEQIKVALLESRSTTNITDPEATRIAEAFYNKFPPGEVARPGGRAAAAPTAQAPNPAPDTTNPAPTSNTGATGGGGPAGP